MKTHQTSTDPHASYDCALCHDLGWLGRSPDGEFIYCACLKGLDGQMSSLTKTLQVMAETLARIDAQRKRGLSLCSAEHYQDLVWAYQRIAAEHDETERKYWALKNEEIELAEPEYQFFPDYVDGEMVLA